MSALPAIDQSALLDHMIEMRALILTDTPPPWRAVPHRDARRKPIAWIDQELVAHWRQAGYVVKDDRGWTFRNIPGPRPIVADDGRVQAEVRENRMQRLARDLEIDGPLAEAGHRLVADGLRMQVGSLRSGMAPVIADGRPRNAGAEEDRMLHRLKSRMAVRDALAELTPRGRRIAEAICLQDLSLEEVARREHLSEADTRDAFMLVLLRLSRHYGTMPGWAPIPKT